MGANRAHFALGRYAALSCSSRMHLSQRRCRTRALAARAARCSSLSAWRIECQQCFFERTGQRGAAMAQHSGRAVCKIGQHGVNAVERCARHQPDIQLRQSPCFFRVVYCALPGAIWAAATNCARTWAAARLKAGLAEAATGMDSLWRAMVCGLTWAPLTRNSKCRWGPVAQPVWPTAPNVLPLVDALATAHVEAAQMGVHRELLLRCLDDDHIAKAVLHAGRNQPRRHPRCAPRCLWGLRSPHPGARAKFARRDESAS
jgi:hypothetical protein